MKLFDILTTGPNLTINGNLRAKNQIGGTLTICLAVGLLFIAINSIITLIGRRKFNLMTNVGVISSDDYKLVTKNNSLIAFNMYDRNSIPIPNGERLVTFDVEKVIVEQNFDQEGNMINFNLFRLRGLLKLTPK